MAAPKGNKFAGSRKGIKNKKNTPEIRSLRDMVQARITPELLDRVQKKNPEELVRAAVRLEAIFNPQKHIVSGDLKIEIVNYLGNKDDQTAV
jgi:hypothetical protein